MLGQLSKLVVHPSPPNSMLEHTAKDGPNDASLKHAQSVCILRSDGPGLVSNREPPGESMCDISHISCELEVFRISTVGEAP